MSINSPANQHTPDERQQKCWDNYLETIAKGTPNAYRSALKAGYSDEHSRHIRQKHWFDIRDSALRRKELVTQAEKNFKHFLKMPDTITKKIDGQMVEVEDMQKMKIKADISKYIGSNLASNTYSTKNTVEHGGAVVFTEEQANKSTTILKSFLGEQSKRDNTDVK